MNTPTQVDFFKIIFYLIYFIKFSLLFVFISFCYYFAIMFLYLFVGVFIFHSKVGNNVYIQISVLEYLTE